ncbi:hypothetical protein EDB45_12325 [Vibrio crassostreae]|nr:hypothetical protein EDB45_12325 [Vibrio crassostreae]
MLVQSAIHFALDYLIQTAYRYLDCLLVLTKFGAFSN